MARTPLEEILLFDNGLPNGSIDPGNIEFKWVTDTQPRDVGMFQSKQGKCSHYFYELSKRDWMANYQQMAGNVDNEYAFIEWNGRYFVIGKRLNRVGADNRRVGNQKYEEGYILPAVASILLRMFHGTLPSKMNLLIGHPPMDMQNSKRIADMVKGRLTFSTPNQKYNITIVQTRGFIEIIGGVNRVALTIDDDGKRLKGHRIKGGGPTLAIDLGGGTFDIVDLDKDGSPTGIAQTEMIGINNCISTFQDLVDVEFRDILQEARVKGKISRSQVVDCFRDPEHHLRIGNKMYEAQEIFLESVNELMFSLDSAIDRMLGDDGFARYFYALIGGGGGDVLFDHLCRELLGFFALDRNGELYWGDTVFRTGEPGEMIMANAEGALRTIQVIIATSKKRKR